VNASTATAPSIDTEPQPRHLDAPSFGRRHRVSLLLALLVVVVVGPVVGSNSSQPASRFALTAALVEHHSVDIAPYRESLGVDFARYRGHLRSDKAPGQPIIAVPAYVMAKLVGAESAAHARHEGNLGLWFVTFWSATLPLALLAALLYEECCRFSARSSALAVTLLLVFTTMLLPFGSALFGHVLAAVLVFGAWLLIRGRPLTPRRAAIGGLLAGAAVLTEYETAIVVVVLAAYLVVRERHRLLAFAAGGALPMLVLAWYQWRAFGAPWRTPAAFYSGVLVKNGGSRGGYRVPSLSDLWWMFAGGRGLWVGAPIAIVGIGAAIWLAYRGRGALREYAVIALAVMVPYFILCAGWSGTRLLVDPGPRYLIPALPFLAVPLAALWDRVRVVAIPVSVVGAAVAAGATWMLLTVTASFNILEVYRYYFRARMFVPVLWGMAFGRVGAVLYAVSVAAVVALLVRAISRHRAPEIRAGVRW